ncbi:MAG: class I adenylate-forming enzyme family protein [Gammaproteobacteria bacterium]|nr:class I adenylate-forming enzyme family protein [Gammaproteobacteria bacterium]MDD9958999.1 class I adenylate-forming enzyme family protein [Gammaproteobacteria bacterium]
MLTEEEIRQDLAKLKDIVIAHKAPDAELATHSEVIAGQQFDVFTNAPVNLSGLYDLSLKQGKETFLVYLDERYSFAESVDMARRMARVLKDQYKINPGDRVTLCARNSPEWCIAYMAVTILGAVIVPMNSWWRGSEMEYGVKDSGSKLAIVDFPRFQQLQPFLANLEIEIIQIKPEQETSYFEFYSLLQDVQALNDDEINALNIRPDDNASIMYTSGSTGMPKGVLSTHRNIINALYTWRFVKEINEILRPELVEENPEFQPALLCNVPLFHVTGSHAQFLNSFIYLRKLVMMYKWDAEKALELIEQERISIFHGVPTMTWEIMQSEKFAQTDLSSLRGVQSGGAPRPPKHLKMMLEKFPEVAQPGLGYGLTETNAIGAIISGKFYISKPHSTGRPTPPITEVKIVDETDNDLGPNEVGEICIKGPTIMKGYWNKPEDTAEILKDGWFYTGDIGLLDDLGFLVILDRAKDIVIRGGENIGCAEVEYAITEHPLVSEVSVYGVPDERLGEVPVATVMLKPAAKLQDDELKSFLKEKIAAFKIPEQFYFQYEQLPRIASGKIAKKELRQITIEKLALA